jgi:hypothetical protein
MADLWKPHFSKERWGLIFLAEVIRGLGIEGKQARTQEEIVMKNIQRLLLVSIFFVILSIGTKGFCQGLYGVRVYDADNQFLGLLVDALPSFNTENKGMTIYLSNVNYPLWINGSGNTLTSSLYFKGPYGSCSGQPYVDEWRVVVKVGSKFYVATGKGETTGPGEFWNEGPNGCVPGVSFGTTKYPVKEVTLPFALPVSLPLKFVYDFLLGHSYLPNIQK